MSEPLEVLVERYRGRGIFVDTNLLLLWFVGAFDQPMISRFKRTQQFVPEDFQTIESFLAIFKTRVTSPHVLTEVSNLAKGMDYRAEAFFSEVFSPMVRSMSEENVASASLVDKADFGRFGLADSAIMALVKGKYLLLTDDFRLSQYFASIGGAALNFNHIRTAFWT
jgi:hypothetical protein